MKSRPRLPITEILPIHVIIQRNHSLPKALHFKELLRHKRNNHYHAKVRKGLKPSPKSLSIVLVVLSAFCAVAAQQKTDTTVTPLNSQAYRIGEHLTYDVSFSQFVSAAHIELFVVARGTFFVRDGIQLRGHAETTGVVSVALFALNNDSTSYVGPVSGLPFHFQEVVRQAGRTSESSNDFKQAAAIGAS